MVMTGADQAEADDQQVFENLYPRTAKALRKIIPGDDMRSHIFVSWLATVPDAEGIPVPASITDQGQVQIDYSEKEYRRLIAESAISSSKSSVPRYGTTGAMTRRHMGQVTAETFTLVPQCGHMREFREAQTGHP